MQVDNVDKKMGFLLTFLVINFNQQKRASVEYIILFILKGFYISKKSYHYFSLKTFRF